MFFPVATLGLERAATGGMLLAIAATRYLRLVGIIVQVGDGPSRRRQCKDRSDEVTPIRSTGKAHRSRDSRAVSARPAPCGVLGLDGQLGWQADQR